MSKQYLFLVDAEKPLNFERINKALNKHGVSIREKQEYPFGSCTPINAAYLDAYNDVEFFLEDANITFDEMAEIAREIVHREAAMSEGRQEFVREVAIDLGFLKEEE